MVRNSARALQCTIQLHEQFDRLCLALTRARQAGINVSLCEMIEQAAIHITRLAFRIVRQQRDQLAFCAMWKGHVRDNVHGRHAQMSLGLNIQ